MCAYECVCLCGTGYFREQISDFRRAISSKKCILDGGVGGWGGGEQIFGQVVQFRNWQAGLGGQFSKKKNAVCEISPKVTWVASYTHFPGGFSFFVDKVINPELWVNLNLRISHSHMKLDKNRQLGPDFGSHKVSTIFAEGYAVLETGGGDTLNICSWCGICGYPRFERWLIFPKTYWH